MSLASWKPDPKLTREKHKWKFLEAREYEKTWSMGFYCENSGCRTTKWMPCNPNESDLGSICFDTSKAVQLTDRDGNEIM